MSTRWIMAVAASSFLIVVAAGAAGNGTCKKDSDCRPGSLCLAGTCQAVECPDIYLPVCGVDGKTYSNACFAHRAHVAIAHEGECGEPTSSGAEGAAAADASEWLTAEVCVK
jgi:hypothetical protein